MHHIIASGCTFSKQEEAQSSTGWTLTPEATRWDSNAPVGGFPGECFFPSQGILFLILHGKDVMTFPCNNNFSSPYTFFLLNGDMELHRHRHLFIQKIF